MKGNLIGAGLALSMLCGCVSMPTFQTAKPLGSTHVYRVHAADPKPIESNIYQFVDAGDTVLYHQESGGGGAALGVLLGPLGVAANMAAIKSRTSKEALSLRSAFTPHVMQDFSANLVYQPDLRPATASDAAAVTFSPMLELTRMGTDQVRIGARLRVAQGTPQQRDYIYVLPGSYSFASLQQGLSRADQAKMDSAIAQGFRWTLDTYRSDTQGALHANRSVRVQSDFVNTRIKMKLKGYAFEQGHGRVGFVLAAPSWPTVYSMPSDMAVVTSG